MIPPPQAGEYRVIYADPPWRFATYSDKGKGRSAEAHYDCLSLDEIKALPVADWAAPDAVLLMWATDPLLPRALEVLGAWGFTYKTVGLYWVKLNKSAAARLSKEWPLLAERDFFTGLGFWTRANPEPCLLATRGHPKRRAGDVPKLLIAPGASIRASPTRRTSGSSGSCPAPISRCSPARAGRAGTAGAIRRSCSIRAPWRPAGDPRAAPERAGVPAAQPLDAGRFVARGTP